jgi:hypothetical protein
MITITNQDTFAKVLANALASVGNNTDLLPGIRKRYVNPIAKAAARIERSGLLHRI